MTRPNRPVVGGSYIQRNLFAMLVVGLVSSLLGACAASPQQTSVASLTPQSTSTQPAPVSSHEPSSAPASAQPSRTIDIETLRYYLKTYLDANRSDAWDVGTAANLNNLDWSNTANDTSTNPTTYTYAASLSVYCVNTEPPGNAGMHVDVAELYNPIFSDGAFDVSFQPSDFDLLPQGQQSVLITITLDTQEYTPANFLNVGRGAYLFTSDTQDILSLNDGVEFHVAPIP